MFESLLEWSFIGAFVFLYIRKVPITNSDDILAYSSFGVVKSSNNRIQIERPQNLKPSK